jgi:hypothetical protein
MFDKQKAARSEAQAVHLATVQRTPQDIKDDCQVMRAVLIFNMMLKQDKMTMITYASIKEHIPAMCQAIRNSKAFQDHFKDIKIDRLLKVWPEIMHLKDDDLNRLIKTLEGSQSNSKIKTP